MLNLNSIVNDYETSRQAMLDRVKNDRMKQSQVDSTINDILHAIEYTDISASNMSKMTKYLKQLYITRRELKESIIVIDNIIRNNKSPNDELVKSEERFNRYKVESGESLVRILDRIEKRTNELQ